MHLTSKVGKLSVSTVPNFMKIDIPGVLKDTEEIPMRHLIIKSRKSGEFLCHGGYTWLLQYLY